MQWSDEGIILSVRPHGETAAVAEIFTRAHGRHSASCMAGARASSVPCCRPAIMWTPRGRRASPSISVTSTSSCARVTPRKRWTIRWRSPGCRRCVHWRVCFPSATRIRRCSRWPCSCSAISTSRTCGRRSWCAGSWRCWMSSALDWTSASCAATGSNDNLIYVSPKSGRAVSESAGSGVPRPAAALAVLPVQGAPGGADDGGSRRRTGAHGAFPRNPRSHPARGAVAGDPSALQGSHRAARGGRLVGPRVGADAHRDAVGAGLQRIDLPVARLITRRRLALGVGEHVDVARQAGRVRLVLLVLEVVALAGVLVGDRLACRRCGP